MLVIRPGGEAQPVQGFLNIARALSAPMQPLNADLELSSGIPSFGGGFKILLRQGACPKTG